MNKKLKEMNAIGAGIAHVAPGAFKTKKRTTEQNVSAKVVGAAVYPKKGKDQIRKHGKELKEPPYKTARLTVKERKLTKEDLLREAIRKIIFYSKVKFYEEEGKRYLEEQKLRSIISVLLKEKQESARFNSTGENYAHNASERILAAWRNEYLNLSKPEERAAFKIQFYKGVGEAVETYDLQTAEEANSAGTAAGIESAKDKIVSPEDIKQPAVQGELPLDGRTEAEKQKLKTRIDNVLEKVLGPESGQQTVATTNAEMTGNRAAQRALRTAIPQVLDEYFFVTEDADRADFINFLVNKTLEPTFKQVEDLILATQKQREASAAMQAPAAQQEEPEQMDMFANLPSQAKPTK